MKNTILLFVILISFKSFALTELETILLSDTLYPETKVDIAAYSKKITDYTNQIINENRVSSAKKAELLSARDFAIKKYIFKINLFKEKRKSYLRAIVSDGPTAANQTFQNVTLEKNILLANFLRLDTNQSLISSDAAPIATPTVAPTATPIATPTVTPTATPIATPTVIPTATPTVIAHPRLLITPTLLQSLRERVAANSAEWIALKAKCDSTTNTQSSGYHGAYWAENVANLSLCYLASQNVVYATKAIIYLDALANDKSNIGDGLGGALRVNDGNYGYSIRNVGVYLAFGYDWMYDYLSVNAPSKLSLYRSRLNSWINLYETQNGTGQPNQGASYAGYLHDVSAHGGISNYFISYFLTKALTGFATYESDSDIDAATHISDARALFSTIRSTYDLKLKGGDFTEGYMYGEETVSQILWYLITERSADDNDLFDSFNYPSEVVQFHLHSLIPSGLGVYQGHDWKVQYHGYPSSEKLSAHSMLPLAHAFKGTDLGKEAQFYVNNLSSGASLWERFLFLDRSSPTKNYKTTAPLSYLAEGTGSVFMRSSWDSNAIWASLYAGPGSAVDHQHADQGHISIVRGNDPLLIDAGDYGSSGWQTTFHNSVLIDTKGEMLFNKDGQVRPGQSICRTCAKNVKVTKFNDDGETLSVQADITQAYSAPWWSSTTPDPMTSNPATKVIRNMVFARPGYIAVYDSVVLKKDIYQPSVSLHTYNAPTVSGDTFSAVTGTSKVIGKTLLPSGANFNLVTETNSWNDKDGNANNYGTNAAGRIETTSAPSTGKTHHQFLQLLKTTDTSGAMPAITRLSSTDGNASSNVVGLFIADATDPTVIIFSSASGTTDITGTISYTLPVAANRHLIQNLPVNTKFSVAFPASDTGAQQYQLTPDVGGSFTSSSKGTLSFDETLRILAPLPVAYNTYYISPSGADANAGTEALPFKTFNKAFTTMVGGDELILLDGTYSLASGTGTIHWNNGANSKQIPAGVSATEMTYVHAKNPGKVVVEGQLFIGRSTRKDSYIKIQGITFEGGGHLYNSDYSMIKDCGFHGPFSVGTNDHHMYADNNLIEDVWIWASGQRIIAINYRSHKNVWRRVLVRGDGCGTVNCTGSGNPNVGITVYDSSEISLQNVMVVDRVLAVGDEPYGDFAVAQHTPDSRYYFGKNEWLGTLSLHSSDGGYHMEADYGATIDPTIKISNAVAWDSVGASFNISREGTNHSFKNLIAKSTGSDGVRLAPELKSGIIQNVIVAGAGRFGINSVFVPSNTDVFNAASGNYNQTTCSVNCRTTNPLSDGVTPSLKYLTRIESGSALKGAGASGADIGANIIYRYGVDGTRFGETGYNTLGTTPLWPWPNQARIKAEMCANTTRGFCGAGKQLDGVRPVSLTSYIWEYLGNPVPAGIDDVPAPVSYKTYYLSPSGNDTNSGLLNTAPLSSFSKAWTLLQPGDTLLVADGSYANPSPPAEKSGSAGAAIIIKAINPGKAILTSTLNLRGSSYLDFSGFKITGTASAVSVQSNGIGKVSHHLTFKEIGFNCTNTVLNDNACFSLSDGTHHTILEDSWGWGGGRYVVMCYGGNGGNPPNLNCEDNVFRRLVLRMGPSTSTSGNPQASLALYYASNNIVENVIAIDGNAASNSSNSAFYITGHAPPPNADSNKFYGVIALNNLGAGFFLDCPGAVCNSNEVHNSVFWNSSGGGMITSGGTYAGDSCRPVNIDHNTVGSSGTHGYTLYACYDGVLTNNIFFENAGIGAYKSGTGTIITNHHNGYFGNTAGLRNNLTAGVGDLTTNPNLAYITRIETASAYHNAGSSGDIGANIINRYKDGVLSNNPLWPWPNQARIKNEMCANSTQGFCGTGKQLDGVRSISLTSYIWEYLGNPVPVGLDDTL